LSFKAQIRQQRVKNNLRKKILDLRNLTQSFKGTLSLLINPEVTPETIKKRKRRGRRKGG
jgi:hypothetical protein